MVRIILLLLLTVFPYCFALGQGIVTPKGWVVIDSLSGNLDIDNDVEKVFIYNTTDSTDFGKHREIRIFKRENDSWVLWESSRTVLLNSDDGGMMGDPYGGIEIQNKVLSVHHNGGSSWKWGYTDKYRFQNNQFELIGYSGLNGKPCEEWIKVDFNISTGKINYVKEYEECSENEEVNVESKEETFYEKGITRTLKDRRWNETEIVSPKMKYKFRL